jgi:hypothetical protein
MKAKDIQVGTKLVRVRFSEDETLPMYLSEQFLTVVEVERGPSAVYSVRLHPEGRPPTHGCRYTGVEVALEFEVADSPGHAEARRLALAMGARRMQQEISDRWEMLQRVRATIQLVGQT